MASCGGAPGQALRQRPVPAAAIAAGPGRVHTERAVGRRVAAGAHAAGGAAEVAGRRAVGAPDDRLRNAAGCGDSVASGTDTQTWRVHMHMQRDSLWRMTGCGAACDPAPCAHLSIVSAESEAEEPPADRWLGLKVGCSSAASSPALEARMIWKHRLAVGRRSASTDRQAWVQQHGRVSRCRGQLRRVGVPWANQRLLSQAGVQTSRMLRADCSTTEACRDIAGRQALEAGPSGRQARALMRSEISAGQSSGTLTSDRPPRTGAMPVTISHSITPKLYTSAFSLIFWFSRISGAAADSTGILLSILCCGLRALLLSVLQNSMLPVPNELLPNLAAEKRSCAAQHHSSGTIGQRSNK